MDNKERCLTFSKMVDCYLNSQINNLFDLAENMKALDNFQSKINELQAMKDTAQIEHNGIALTILRKYVMYKKFGKFLIQSLIRQYYDLNDEQIKHYDRYSANNGKRDYYITNPMVLYRKGDCFDLSGNYKKSCIVNNKEFSHLDLYRNSFYFLKSLKYNPDANEFYLSLDEHSKVKGAKYFLENNYADWSNINVLKSLEGLSISSKPLLFNQGYIAWQGIDCIEETIRHLQSLNNKNYIESDSNYILDEEANERIAYYSANIYELYSYLPLQEAFVLEHQGELNWDVLELNPRIEWTFPLVQILLERQELKPESEQPKPVIRGNEKILRGNKGMYDKLFKPLLNDGVISDLEKLYDI